jgi:hypothetical protein
VLENESIGRSQGVVCDDQGWIESFDGSVGGSSTGVARSARSTRGRVRLILGNGVRMNVN